MGTRFMIGMMMLVVQLGIAPMAAAQTSDNASDTEITSLTQAQTVAMPVLDAFLAGFNALDMEAMESTLHFPHFRLNEAGEMTHLDAPGQLPVEAMKKMIGADWNNSVWLERNVIHYSDSKIHVDTKVARYDKAGGVIDTFDSMYILTKVNGKWGIKMRSSFAPQ